LRNVARLPILFQHVAVMPDVHWGLGATVGTVLASERAVIPAAVGVDIGCGVSAARLSLTSDWLGDGDRLKELRRAIEETIPVGFDQRAPGQSSAEADRWSEKEIRRRNIRAPLPGEVLDKAVLQVGTLGGGNHFMEVCLDQQDRLWLMLHSGSRHIGKRIADHYIREAKDWHKKQDTFKTLPDPNLAWLEAGHPLFEEYLADLFWAQHYARFNRDEMMRELLRVVARFQEKGRKPRRPMELVAEQVNCHHNYVNRETHFGKKVYVTRKGALSARAGEPGVIPGSMGAASYIVEGLGNPESFCSCSHGAGRAMSRNEAKRRFTVNDLIHQTEGVECRKDKGVLDEIPTAYKNIDEVMDSQRDLVKVRSRLRQVICVKG